MAETIITRAAVVERIAQPIIDEYHQHLAAARILYLFTTQERKHHTKTVLATAAKTSAIQKFLSSETGDQNDGYDFVILVGVEEWAALSPDQQIALVDHELMHCWVNEKGAYCLRAHDVEEFSDILARHGFWKSDVRTFGMVARQLPLDFLEKNRHLAAVS